MHSSLNHVDDLALTLTNGPPSSGCPVESNGLELLFFDKHGERIPAELFEVDAESLHMSRVLASRCGMVQIVKMLNNFLFSA